MSIPTIHRLAAAFIIAAAVLLLAPAGVSAKPGDSCGGFIGNILCGKGEFCQAQTGLCSTMIPGTCTTVPRFCTRIFKPVCGCDGKTYGNDCVRQAARVSKLYDGPCRKY